MMRSLLMRRRALLGGALGLMAATLIRRAAADDAPAAEGLPPDALTPIRERYLALQSYADTGTVLAEQQWTGAPVVTESGSFTTYFRAPRNFFFEFNEGEGAGGDRLVIWCDGGDFQSWWKTTNVHDVYDGGRGALAFLLALSPTMGTSNLVPGLIFARAELGGAVAGLREARDDGEEEVDGARFAKVHADILVAGNVTRTQPTTMWIDPETKLIHRLLEDTPPDFGGLNRRTTVLKPQADIEIEDSRFTFEPPS
jgi:hypothetical protein